MTLPSGRKFNFEFDGVGGLAKIKLPSSDVSHTLGLQFGFGHVKLYHNPPGSQDPLMYYYSMDGARMTQKKSSPNAGITLYKYNRDNQMTEVISGDFKTTVKYHPDQWVQSVDHVEDGDDEFSSTLTELHDKKASKDWESGVPVVSLAESRIAYNARSGLAGASFNYVFNGNVNLVVRGRIGGRKLPGHFVRHSLDFSGLNPQKEVGQFTLVTHNLKETSIADSTATFVYSPTSEKLLIHGRQIYSGDFALETCHGKVETATRRMLRDTGEFQQILHFKYDDDGHLDKVVSSSGEWKYKHDDNGRIKSRNSPSGEKDIFLYDTFGRLSKMNERPIAHDSQGRIKLATHRFLYDSRGLLNKVLLKNRPEDWIRYNYDHVGRLVAIRDARGNSTQLFYANPDKPYLVSHVFKPVQASLVSLVYDDRDRLIFADVDRKKFYVVCDLVGSPILFVSPEGRIEREVSRSPFGKVFYDSDSSLGVPIGFAGGIEDNEAGLIHIQVIKFDTFFVAKQEKTKVSLSPGVNS